MNKIDRFRLYLLQEGCKPSTINLKLKQIKRLQDHNPSFSVDGFNKYILLLKEQGRINSYINNLIIVARQWGKCFGIKELTTLTRIKGNNSTFIRATLSDEEIDQLLTLPYYGSRMVFIKKGILCGQYFFQCLLIQEQDP